MTEEESIEHARAQTQFEKDFLDVAIVFIEKGAHPDRLRRALHGIESRLASDRSCSKTESVRKVAL